VPPSLPASWSGLIDDAAIFPPGNAPLADALAAHVAHRESRYADLVGAFVLRDTDLPLAREVGTGPGTELSIVVTGGAGQIAGPFTSMGIGVVVSAGQRYIVVLIGA